MSNNDVNNNEAQDDVKEALTEIQRKLVRIEVKQAKLMLHLGLTPQKPETPKDQHDHQ
jgi:hypothetical protein